MGLVDSIPQTLLSLGQIQARGAENLGAIQAASIQQQGAARAQGAQATGQLIGQLGQNLAGIASAIPQQMAQQKAQAQESQLRQGQIDQQQAAIAGQAKANEIVAKLPKDANGLYDLGAMFHALAAQNVPLPQQKQLLDAVEGVNKITQSFKATQTDHAAELADTILSLHRGQPVTADSVHLGLAAAQDAGIASADDVQRITQALAGGASPDQVLQIIRGQGSKFKSDNAPVKLSEGDILATPSGQVLAKNPKANVPKTESELALAAAGTGPEADSAKAALQSLQGPRQNAEAETTRHNREMERIQGLQQGREAAQAAETARHNHATENPLGVVGAPGGGAVPDVAPGQKNDVFLKTLPSGQASLVKALAEGRQAFPTGNALRAPYWQGMLDAVAKYDPSFDAVNYNSRSKTRSDFTSGGSAKQVNALNTVAGHLSDLSAAADQLGNTSLPFVNSVKNLLSKAGGSSKVTNFETAKQAVADELTRVWRQSGGTLEDIKGWQSSLSTANSPEQLHDAFATIGSLLESKLDAMQNQYQQGMGTADVQMVTPKARAALDALEGKKAKTAATATPTKIGRFDVVSVK